MSGLFGKPKVSKPKPVVIQRPVEEKKVADTRAAEDEEARRKRASLGSNILAGAITPEEGAPGPVIQQKRLLGE